MIRLLLRKKTIVYPDLALPLVAAVTSRTHMIGQLLNKHEVEMI